MHPQRLVVRRQLWFAPRTVMLRTDVPAQPAALLQQLFYHPKRDAKALRDLLASAFLVVVSGKDSFSQIDR